MCVCVSSCSLKRKTSFGNSTVSHQIRARNSFSFCPSFDSCFSLSLLSFTHAHADTYTHAPFHSPFFLSCLPSVHISIYVSIYPSIHLSSDLFIYLFIYLSIYLLSAIYLSVLLGDTYQVLLYWTTKKQKISKK